MKNAGDEILKEYFLRRVTNVSWSVLSSAPKRGEFPRFPAGFRSFFSFRWLRTLLELRRSDGMVFGGGSLFTDTESVQAPILWFSHAIWAWILRKSIILAFQGIGPFRTRLGAWCAARVIRRASFISVRDAASFTRACAMVERACHERARPEAERIPHQSAKRIGARRVEGLKKNTEIVQSFDPSILLLDAEIPNMRTNNVITYIPRFSTTFNAKNSIHSVFRALINRGMSLNVISLNSSDPREEIILCEIERILNVQARRVYSLQEASQLLPGGIIVTERFHGALLAISASLPFVALYQSKGDKLDQLAVRFGCPSKDPASFSTNDVIGIDWNTIRRNLHELSETCREEALQGERALIHFLRGH